jgi:hypothetical protein
VRIFFRKQPPPPLDPDDVVVTSVEVLDRGLPIMRIIHWSHGYTFLSGLESEGSRPVAVHFKHIADIDSTASNLTLKEGGIALRVMDLRGVPGNWKTYGPWSDEHLDELLQSGRIDDVHNDLTPWD